MIIGMVMNETDWKTLDNYSIENGITKRDFFEKMIQITLEENNIEYENPYVKKNIKEYLKKYF